MNRIDRLVAMLTTLQSKKNVSVGFLTEKYNISERTVYRDLKALGEIGVPILFEEGRGYSIIPGYFLPPLSLTSAEANSLILMASLASKFGDRKISEHATTALEKIRAGLRTVNEETVDLQENIRVYHPEAERKDDLFIADIQEAITKQKLLVMQYTNNEHIRRSREVEPIGLTFYSGQWHLIAWCWFRKAYRDFKTTRIESLKETGESFRKNNHIDLPAYIQSIS